MSQCPESNRRPTPSLAPSFVKSDIEGLDCISYLSLTRCSTPCQSFGPHYRDATVWTTLWSLTVIRDSMEHF